MTKIPPKIPEQPKINPELKGVWALKPPLFERSNSVKFVANRESNHDMLLNGMRLAAVLLLIWVH